MAANGWVVPNGMDAADGDTAIDSSTAELTFSVVVPLIPFTDALIMVCPAATVYANPLSSTLATDGSPEVHIAVAVTSFVVKSL